MTVPGIPYEHEAEQWLAGVCVASDAGYQLAIQRVAPDSFYEPTLRRLVEACSLLRDLSGIDNESLRHRIQKSARLADVEVRTVRQLVADRPLQWDKNGTLAARVRRACESRSAMEVAGELRTRLGRGEPLEKVVADLAPAIHALLGTAA